MQRESRRLVRWTAVCLAIAACWPAAALDMATFEKNLTQITLDNGLTFLIYRRPTAPVVTFFTHVDVGSAQEVPGITGLAHMFEHMAFKGTTVVGTKNYKKEKAAMEEVDRAYAAYQEERLKPEGPDTETLAQLEQALEQAEEAADAWIERDEFSEIVNREGGVGLNAFTNADSTGYVLSLPANKVELWAYLESNRFLDPVFREFYKERDVVQEERRMRVESQPIGRLLEKFVASAFQAHPYHQPVVGYMSDLQSFTRQDAFDFYKKYYVPANMTIAIVGDVNAEEIRPMLESYFGRLKDGPTPPPLRTREPAQTSETVIRMPDPSQPIYMEGYHRPSVLHADDAVYDAIADVLSTGRTSRLYRSLVRDKKIAAFAGAFNGFPGTKYPHLMLFFAVATPGNGNDVTRDALRAEIERLKTEPVTDEELKMVKTRAKASLIWGLRSNGGIARALALYHAQLGDWRELFHNVERIEKVTKDDIMRVAKTTFVPTNRTVGMIVAQDALSEGSPSQAGEKDK